LLIRDYTPSNSSARRAVALTRFRKGRKRLDYINARHVSGIDNRTCEAVREAIQTHRPQLVIIEGFPTDCGLSPRPYVDYSNHQAKRGFPHGETAYAAFLACQHDIPFMGGEPTDEHVSAAMVKLGYPPKEIMAFCCLRTIPQDRRDGKRIDEATFAAVLGEKGLTLMEFKAWYAAHKGSKHFLEISPEDVAPHSPPSGSYFQIMSHRIGLVRERHLDTLIADSLTRRDHILVVYGDAHLVKSRPVFEKMLGPGRNLPINRRPAVRTLRSHCRIDMASPP
jgi:hypothetical protein